MVVTGMRIQVWSDVVCPWCYIGKRRLEKALAGFPGRAEVEIIWRSFQLDPSAPGTATENVVQLLGRRYGGGDDAGRAMVARTEAVAAEEGLQFHHAEAPHVNTLDAHRLLHLALEDGGPASQGRLKEELLTAYFTRAENVADPGVLLRAVGSVGLDQVRAEQVLAGDAYAADVEADIRWASALGATGVPFFVLDDRYGIPGAQPTEVFREVLDRVWAESHPRVQLLGGDTGPESVACGPDGCAV
jgi:predicted DsbA family dithiol-disulfide isomerase